MASLYTAFLDEPSTSRLADDASLVYVPTTTEVHGATAILQHVQAQRRQVERQEEAVLHAVEGADGGSLCLETRATFLFKTGGGAFLPGIEPHLLDDRTVTVPLVHVVAFDGDRRIRQVRLYWDQGALLKQVEAIGRSGRNWPIRDSRAQLEAVGKSIRAEGPAAAAAAAAAAAVGSRTGSSSANGTSKRVSVSATRDPHASLALFAPRDPSEEAASRSYNGPKLAAPRASARPAPRNLEDIMSGDPPAASSPARSTSPSKADGTILKGGAGKYFSNNRLFDEEDDERAKSPERKKTYKDKYEHFAFGHGEDAPPSDARPTSGRLHTKNAPTFDFADFATPPKIVGRSRPDYDRQWGPGVDEDDPPSPVRRPVVHHARPDAETHFALVDESPAAAEKPKSLQRQKGMGLYQDPLHADERTAKKPNINNARRGDDFGAHYTLTDEVTPKEKKIYKTAGDGMGGRKATSRSWGLGDDSDPEVDAHLPSSVRGRAVQA